MHGLVFEIIEEWIIKEHGVDIWHEVKEKAGCATKDQEFLRRAYYRDEELVDLFIAASELLSTPVKQILEAYGRHFVMYHFANGYDELLKCQGSTLRQWLSNLNAMHDHLKRSFPGEKFVAPIFWCEDCDEVEGSIILHYYSLRGPLFVPMVVGMLEQLTSYHFEVEIKMHQLALQNEGGSSITTWRITAVDETQRWKLSPKAMGPECEDKPVNFDGVAIPNRCPFSGKRLKKPEPVASSDTAVNVETSPTRSRFSPLPPHEITSPASSTADTSSTTDSVFQQYNETEEDSGLSQTEMQEIFPFHILVDNAFHILQVGNLLPKVLKKKVEDFQGLHIQDLVQITRPVLGSSWDWKSLNKLSDQSFFLTPTNSSMSLRKKVSMTDSVIKFKASMLHISNGRVMFTLSPDVQNVAELNSMGLTLSDLPLQSCQRDAVFLAEHVAQEVNKAHKLDKLSKKLASEMNLSNALLNNMLPMKVVDELRRGKTVEPTFHKNVTLFFSDIEGFTKICDQVEPWDVIDMMNQLYSVMDFLVGHFSLYKVETVGDAYMCCSGLPEPDEYHAENVANFALAVVECAKLVKSPIDGLPINVRIGIHTGSCTSGVVGTLTPHYCLFGDMVNTTSRHESTGMSGKIHCSNDLHGRLKHFSKHESLQYNFKARGLVDMKGKGENYTYWLESGTKDNLSANPHALANLSSTVQEMLASKTWKKRRYFGRGSVLGTATGTDYSSIDDSVCTPSENTSQCPSMTGPPYEIQNNFGNGIDNTTSIASYEGGLGILSQNHNSVENLIVNFEEGTEGEILHTSEAWEDLSWPEATTQTELQAKISDILVGTINRGICKDEGRLQINIDEQLREFVMRIASIHNQEQSPGYSFHHVGQVFLRSAFLWESRDLLEENSMSGLGMDPWDRFTLLFSALIHATKHSGVSNTQLERDNHLTYQMYEGKDSCQQRRSVDFAFGLMEEDFPDLFEEISFGCPMFKRNVGKVVQCSDLESTDKVQAMIDQHNRINQEPGQDHRMAIQQNITSIGLILAMATVGHYTQSYDAFLSWNRNQLEQNLLASWQGRAEDHSDEWYNDQCIALRDIVLPLARHVQKILPTATYLEKGVMSNIVLWEQSGKEWIAASMLPHAKLDNSRVVDKSGDPTEDLIAANVKVLERLLKDVAGSHSGERDLGHIEHDEKVKQNPYDEIQLAIEMKQKSVAATTQESTPDLPTNVHSELREFVATIAAGYQNNEFHNFLHASHVAHLASLLANGMQHANESVDAADIAHDPLTRFAIVLSALVHDVGHQGVPNKRLAEEKPDLADKYCHKSIAEQNSIDVAWDILMSSRFTNLQHCLFESAVERDRFRKLLVNCVMATDIFDQDLRALRQSRWDTVFNNDKPPNPDVSQRYCKATLVIEHIMQASDIAHTMQAWEIYRHWNECLFHEMYDAFLEGRAEKDPSDGWYQGELWFFDNWVVPLAQDLKKCGLLDVVSDQLIKQARRNRLKWEHEGEKISQELAKTAMANRKLSSLHPSTPAASDVEAQLTSQILAEVESLSKISQRYDRKIKAAVGNLIAVAYKGKNGANELRQKPWTDVYNHFKHQQQWHLRHSSGSRSLNDLRSAS